MFGIKYVASRLNDFKFMQATLLRDKFKFFEILPTYRVFYYVNCNQNSHSALFKSRTVQPWRQRNYERVACGIYTESLTRSIHQFRITIAHQIFTNHLSPSCSKNRENCEIKPCLQSLENRYKFLINLN